MKSYLLLDKMLKNFLKNNLIIFDELFNKNFF